MKKLAITSLKLAFVAGLLYWLVQSGKLDFSQLVILIREPWILVAVISAWLVGTFLGAARWLMLLRGLDLEMGYFRALRLQLIGLFFNTAMPGAVGGDIIKAIYVIREQQTQRRTPAMLTVLLDRVVGLAALFILAAVAVGFDLGFFAARPVMLPLVGFIGIGVVGMLVGFVVVIYPFAPGRDPVARLLTWRVPGFNFLSKVYEALRCYRHRPLVLVGTVLISCVIQLCSMALGYLLLLRLTGQSPAPGVFATVFSTGIMTTALPIAPGGLGVGHVAFDKLFSMAGLTGGANVFNVLVLSQLCLNLIGFVPYLLHRTKLPAGADYEAELAAVAGEA